MLHFFTAVLGHKLVLFEAERKPLDARMCRFRCSVCGHRSRAMMVCLSVLLIINFIDVRLRPEV